MFSLNKSQAFDNLLTWKNCPLFQSAKHALISGGREWKGLSKSRQQTRAIIHAWRFIPLREADSDSEQISLKEKAKEKTVK